MLQGELDEARVQGRGGSAVGATLRCVWAALASPVLQEELLDAREQGRGEGARAGAHARVRRSVARHVRGAVPCVLLVQWLPPYGVRGGRAREPRVEG